MYVTIFNIIRASNRVYTLKQIVLLNRDIIYYFCRQTDREKLKTYSYEQITLKFYTL